VRADGVIMTRKPCRHVLQYCATVQCRVADHLRARLAESMTRHDEATLQTAHNVARLTRPGVPTSLKTLFATPSHKNPSTVIVFQPPQNHLSGPGAQCTCPALSYKRIGHTPILDKFP
jgi:hypothetical protein